MSEVRKYFVKGSWIFNLESMDDKLHVILYSLEDDELEFPITIAGTVVSDFDDMYALIEECDMLQMIAKSRKVTGKEYGRIKEIVSWRVDQRYLRCLASGMSERDAGECYADL